jgi:hypothetical protein
MNLRRRRAHGALKEDADVFGQQHILVEDDFAAGDLPGTVNFPQDILPAANIEVLFGFRSVAVHEKVGVNL